MVNNKVTPMLIASAVKIVRARRCFRFLAMMRYTSGKPCFFPSWSNRFLRVFFCLGESGTPRQGDTRDPGQIRTRFYIIPPFQQR